MTLWFEHDLYDQAVLARLLDHFSATPDLWGRLRIICIDRFPGLERFAGLGQLTPSQLAALAPTAVPVTAEMIGAGRAGWKAFTSPDPTGLVDFVREGAPSLPFMASAFRRHVHEFPAAASGLSLTERLALEAFGDGCDTPARAFGHLHRAEAAPWLGDLMFWPIVARLGEGPSPALTPFAGPQGAVTLTPVGERLLSGEEDWISLNGIDRWVGGLHLSGERAGWRYDGQTHELIQVADRA